MAVTTTDIWFASYLIYKNFDLLDFEVIRRGKGSYTFDITDAEWKTYKLEFSKSETNAIKAQHIALKDLLY